ncbi:MAG: methylenetetrahydrofolate reductase [Bdellovibrionales bacterium]
MSESPASSFTLSFEVFPPKTEEGATKLMAVIGTLADKNPDFISITSGAGGGPISEKTHELVARAREAFPHLSIAPHLPMTRQSREQLQTTLRHYLGLGVKTIIAIRGDPSSVPGDEHPGDAYPNTVDYVRDLRHAFGVEPIVGAYPDVHPMAQSPQQDLDHLKRKADAGARRAITQFFFEPDTFLRFRDKANAATQGRLALIPGIMPIQNFDQIAGFAKRCGARVPDSVTQRFHRHGGDASALFEEGVAHGSELCRAMLREGVSAFHFYTLNHPEMTFRIVSALRA